VATSRAPRFDQNLIARLINTINAHEPAWQAWLADQGITQ